MAECGAVNLKPTKLLTDQSQNDLMVELAMANQVLKQNRDKSWLLEFT